MKRKGYTIGMVGIMTLCLSFSGFSQEEVKIKNVEEIKIIKPLNIRKSLNGNENDQKVVKKKVHQKPVIRLTEERFIRLEKRRDIRKLKK